MNYNYYRNIKPQEEKLYNPYEGYIRGNMFPQLYHQYKISKPFNIEPINEQAKLLTDIDVLTFSLIDLNLYLDIYNDDKYMIDLYNQYKKQLNELKNIYENKYGPLIQNDKSTNTWNWEKGPWPWEGNK